MPHWERMARSDYALRMKENETRYPMSHFNPKEYDIRYLPKPYPDHLTRQPLLDIGEPRRIPRVNIPVIFLVDLWDRTTKRYFGRKYETVYVTQQFMKDELMPQRFAIYATVEAYTLLGLPAVRHHIHDEIPKTAEQHQKLLEKQSWQDEPWRYTIEYLFRKYEKGPQELEDIAEEWNGQVEVQAASTTGATQGTTVLRKGPVKQRKAKKVKLF